MKTYFKQGIYKPINKVKNTNVNSIVYRSSWELKMLLWLDKNPNVIQWCSESVIIPYINPLDKRPHRYFVDFKVKIKEGEQIKNYLIEVKPKKQTEKPTLSKHKKPSTVLHENYTYVINQAKWEAARKWCKDRNIEFLILTEEQLF